MRMNYSKFIMRGYLEQLDVNTIMGSVPRDSPRFHMITMQFLTFIASLPLFHIPILMGIGLNKPDTMLSYVFIVPRHIKVFVYRLGSLPAISREGAGTCHVSILYDTSQ